MSEKKNQDNVEYFFDLAIKEYAEIDLLFYLDKCEYSSLKALCVGLKNGHFITRAKVADVEAAAIVWGTEVAGYFSVRDVEMIPCNFRTKLVRIYNAPPESLFLVFPLPRHVNHEQRRFSRRVNLDQERNTNFGIWHGAFINGDSETLPQLRWFALESRHCEFAELSANGMRLDFEENSPFLQKMAINDEMLLRGNFGTYARADDIYVLGNIVRIMKKPESAGIMSVGCHFRAWRKVTAPANQAWFRSDPQEGIGQISQWLSRNYRSINK